MDGLPTTSAPPANAPVQQEADNNDNNIAPPPAKRQRVSQACGNCRDRKTRCDGRQPVCQACEHRGVASTCRFDQHRRRSVRPPPSYTDPLLYQGMPPTRSDSAARSDAAEALSDLGRTQQVTDPGYRGIVGTAAVEAYRSLARAGNGSRHTVHGHPRADGLATIAGNDDSMYGPSSTVAFLQYVMPVEGRPESGNLNQSTQDISHQASATLHRPATVPDRMPTRTDGFAVLPKRRQADDFLLCYWEFIHPLFPVLHRSSFTRKYQQLWTDEADAQPGVESEAEEAIFTSTLNLVFALGCKFSSHVDPAQRSAVGDDFYQRSRQSYLFDILDSTSMSLVQMLLLTAVYLQSTQYASRCWNSLGLAIRMAQSLGLHVDHHGQRNISQLELEMRRRIWHTGVNLDRLLAMTFGRPSMISQKTDVLIPSLIDDEYLSEHGEGAQPVDLPSRLGLFVSSCFLFELLEEILATFYRDQSGVSSQRQANGATQASEILAPVLDLNRRLDRFAADVPEYLRVTAQGTSSILREDHVHLQQQVLYCRFLYIRLLLLRPLLLMATRQEVRPPTSSELDVEVILSCCSLCTVTACRLIDTLFDNLGTLYRSSGWHSVYFTFAAAIVLLASFKVDDLRYRVVAADIEVSWSRCLAILEHYKEQIPSADQAAHILRSMKARVADISRASNSAQTPVAQPDDAVKPAVNGQALTMEAPPYPLLNLDDIDLLSADNISDAWFGQQLINLDWLELPQT